MTIIYLLLCHENVIVTLFYGFLVIKDDEFIKVNHGVRDLDVVDYILRL